MIISKIDIPKSIKRKRLVYRPSFAAFFSLLGDYFAGLIFLPLWIVLFIKEWNLRQQWNTLLAVLAFFIISLLCSTVFLEKLLRIKDQTKKLSKEDIIAAIQSRYPRYIFQDGRGMITFTQNASWFTAFQRKIIVLLDDHDIYLNTFVLGRADARLIIMAIPNYLICLRIKKQLQPNLPFQ